MWSSRRRQSRVLPVMQIRQLRPRFRRREEPGAIPIEKPGRQQKHQQNEGQQRRSRLSRRIALHLNQVKGKRALTSLKPYRLVRALFVSAGLMYGASPPSGRRESSGHRHPARGVAPRDSQRRRALDGQVHPRFPIPQWRAVIGGENGRGTEPARPPTVAEDRLSVDACDNDGWQDVTEIGDPFEHC
jgi:hypothetical protein